MLSKIWKLCLTSILLVFMLPVQISLGCAGGDYYYEDDHYSFYPAENIFPENPYLEFNFSNWLFMDDNESSRLSLNLDDWQTFFGDNWSKNALRKLIYDSKKEEIELLVSKLQKDEEFVKEKNILARVSNKKHLPFLEYLLYAKKCEPQTNYQSISWYEPTRDSSKMVKLIEKAISFKTATLIK